MHYVLAAVYVHIYIYIYICIITKRRKTDKSFQRNRLAIFVSDLLHFIISLRQEIINTDNKRIINVNS